jgi:hypothetical protein
LKLDKSTSTIKLFITNLQPNHHQILAKSTINKKGKPPCRESNSAAAIKFKESA